MFNCNVDILQPLCVEIVQHPPSTYIGAVNMCDMLWLKMSGVAKVSENRDWRSWTKNKMIPVRDTCPGGGREPVSCLADCVGTPSARSIPSLHFHVWA